MNTLFWISALFGTIFFGLKVLATFIGGAPEDLDIEGGANGQHHGTDIAFKIVSIHSLTGFFMMFGWVGLACEQQYALSSFLSILFASLAGLLMMLVTAYLFKLASLLISPGAQFRTEELLGLRATVYQKIPSNGAGKIQVTLNGYQREVRAVSANQQEIASFVEVAVEKIIDKQTVSVKPVKML